jgi:hypothetical protein
MPKAKGSKTEVKQPRKARALISFEEHKVRFPSPPPQKKSIGLSNALLLKKCMFVLIYEWARGV